MSGTLAAELIEHHRGSSLEAFGLVPEKTGRANLLFQDGARSIQIVFGGAILLEKIASDDIDPFVGALRRENRGNQKFQGVLVHERALRIGIGFIQTSEDLGHTPLLFRARESFLPCHVGRDYSSRSGNPANPPVPAKRRHKPMGRSGTECLPAGAVQDL